ncbi:MAG: tetratricopeptide repeat protein [Anaerolinea sp.]|nr:tetratricopeptide repeat protein [Anaerolinea sp.]
MRWTESLTGRLKTNSSGGLRDALSAGRTAKLTEDYAKALEHFTRAASLAQASGDHGIAVSMRMSAAECLIALGRYDEAAALIEAQHATAGTDRELAHIVLTRGMLAAARSGADSAEARVEYELALRHARTARLEITAVEGRILGALGAQYLAEGNASYAAHLLRDAVAKINAAGDVDSSPRIVGLLGQALVESGQEVEGQHLLERALALAENIGSRADDRHWSSVLGDRAASEGRDLDAKQMYERAIRLSSPDAPAYASLHCALANACLRLHEPEEALIHAENAVTAAEKHPANDGALRCARGTLGVVLRVTGKSREAIPHLEAATGDDSADLDVLRSLAAAHADSGAYDRAITTYQRAITAADAHKSGVAQAQARRDLGLIYFKQGDLHAAIHEWTQALVIYEEHKAAAQAARLLVDLANARKALGQHVRAMKDFEAALMQLNGVDENDLETRGLVLSNAANAYADQGDVESADAFFNEAITISDRLGDEIAESTRCGNYGWFLLTVGRPRRAMSTIDRALQLSKKHNLALHTAVQTDNLGLVHDALGDYATALDFHRQALNLVLAEGSAYWTAFVRINLATTLIALAHIDEAAEHLAQALVTGRETGRVELVIGAQTGLAQVALNRREAQAADAPLNEALALARKHELRRWLAEALSVRSHQQAQLGHAEEAAAAWEEAHKLYAILHMPQAKLQPAWLAKA